MACKEGQRARHRGIFRASAPARSVGQEDSLGAGPVGRRGRAAPAAPGLPRVRLLDPAGRTSGRSIRFGGSSISASGGLRSIAADDGCGARSADRGHAIRPARLGVHARLRVPHRVFGDAHRQDHDPAECSGSTGTRSAGSSSASGPPAQLRHASGRPPAREDRVGVDGAVEKAADQFLEAVDPESLHSRRSTQLRAVRTANPWSVNAPLSFARSRWTWATAAPPRPAPIAPQGDHLNRSVSVVQLANRGRDEVRRAYWNDLRLSDDKQAAKRFKDARWRLLKRPEKLSDQQAATLARIRAAGGEAWRAYELKETVPLSRVARSRLEPFVRLGKTIRGHRYGIFAAIRLGINRGPRRHPCRESLKSLLKRKRSRSFSGLVSISPRGTTAARGPFTPPVVGNGDHRCLCESAASAGSRDRPTKSIRHPDSTSSVGRRAVSRLAGPAERSDSCEAMVCSGGVCWAGRSAGSAGCAGRVRARRHGLPDERFGHLAKGSGSNEQRPQRAMISGSDVLRCPR